MIVPRTLPSAESIRTVHLMAICGTGMGSFAGLLQRQGLQVTGSDAGVYPPMSTQLAALGIPVMDGFRAENLDHCPDLVVVGNAITRVNPEAQALLASDLAYTSFPEALHSLYLRQRHPVVVTGTHGKTTTTALLAWCLLHAGRDPGFLVGGVMNNLGSSFRGGAEGAPFVIEGDEYDTAFFEKTPKFLHYGPRTAILTSVEFDHADIYESLEVIERAFADFVALLPDDGLLVVRPDGEAVDRVLRAAPPPCPTIEYGPRGRWQGEILSVGEDGMHFRVLDGERELLRTRCLLIGDHNLENLVAVCAVLLHLGLSPAEIDAGLSSFEGIRRRQELFATVGGIALLDDFAHHPTAVRETLAATRLRFGTRRLWAVFEPRTNTTRRNVFQRDYAEAFGVADRVLLAPVDDPQKVPEGERMDVDRLAADIGGAARALDGVDAIVDTLVRECEPGDVVLLMSNGAFGGIYRRLPDALAERFGETIQE
jgi:UDP-N-acetylmuramate: L-alanyl-gamma-D-glutamyl-meso-diaminopimelate ligase